jgi:biofilm PGA synthesis N-glycosyltransferase PgaC
MDSETYAIITPARNEAKYIQQTIDSLIAQSRHPVEWIIVDDGSTDETAAIVERAAEAQPWIRLIRAPDRGDRVVGAGVVEAFNIGLRALRHRDASYLCKLDADLVLPPHYFDLLIKYFDTDPQLGIACGRIREGVGTQSYLLRHEPEMVFGAAKFYRRTCFDAIGGLEPSIGWDGIDCYQAMRRGWRTATLPDPAIEILHLRRMGTSHKNILHGCSRRGRGLRYNRSHPLWVVASATYRMFDRPYGIAGLCVLWGYLDATARQTPQIPDPEFGQFLRTWQMRKLRRVLL